MDSIHALEMLGICFRICLLRDYDLIAAVDHCQLSVHFTGMWLSEKTSHAQVLIL